MDVGFLTACLNTGLEDDVLPWAKENGFKSVEIGGMHGGFFKKDFAEDIKEMLDEFDITVTAIGNFKNWFEGEEKLRKMNWDDLKNTIETAAALKIPCVTTFVGLNNQLDYQGNVKMFKKEWLPVIEFARELDVKIAIENCPMKGAYALNGGNMMFTPGIMGELFMMTPDNFGLNFDPSHLFWQMVDVNLVVEEFSERIFHTHAKDTQINKETRDFQGVFGSGSYTFRLPGLGQIDWGSYIDTLKEVGYNGVLSIEMEDPNYEGSQEKRKEGLITGKKFLDKFI
jgi:sugar phosphate isomerase/epimerase